MIKPITPNQLAIILGEFPGENPERIETFIRGLGKGPQNEMTVPEEQKDPMTEYDVMILPEDQEKK
ncbi:MAG: hypothetical protein WC629_01865 [Candidatus Paceibacterota bacterium]|jgi:hypothetical protein